MYSNPTPSQAQYQALDDKVSYGKPIEYDEQWCGIKREDRSCRDCLFALIFLIAVGVFIAISIYAFSAGKPAIFKHVSAVGIFEKWVQLMSNKDGWILFWSFLFAFAVALLWMEFMKRCTSCFIYVTLCAGILGSGIGGIAFIVYGIQKRGSSSHNSIGLIVLGAGFLLTTLILLLAVCFMRSKIQLTAALMTEACRGMQNRSGLVLVITFIVVLLAAFIIFFVASTVFLVSIPAKGTPPHPTNNTLIASIEGLSSNGFVNVDPNNPTELNITFKPSTIRWFLLYYILILFWVIEFLIALYQTSVAGSIASWYFSRSPTVEQESIPSLRSLGRAMTKSFGSLALGSLIIAIVNIIQAIARKAEEQAKKEGNMLLRFILCCFLCCVGCVKHIIQFINKYSFIYVAMYGESFCGGARQCFNLLGRNPVSMIFTDHIGGFVILVGEIFGVALVIFFSVVLSYAMNHGVVSFPTIFIIAIVVFVVFRIIGQTVTVSLDTTMVCYLEDIERNRTSGRYFASEDLQETIQDESAKRSLTAPHPSAA